MSAIFVPKMNVSQGLKELKLTTITRIRARGWFRSRDPSYLSLAYVYITSNASQNQKSQADDAAQVIQRFVDGTLCHNADSSVLPASASSLVAPDYSNTYRLNINDPQRQDENFALIREIVDVMPELDMVQLLYEVFVTRCQGPLGNVVHTPTFMKQAETLYECFSDASPEAQAIALFNTFSMDILACHLLAVRISLHYVSNVCLLFHH